ncbi:thioredoxin family protein [Candidatus Dojkabacteria bacterium]|nr:thioredoxin family protein [Candidatus Dojkabacteria bacterium]
MAKTQSPKSAKTDEVFEVSVSDEAIQLLTPAAILLGSIIIGAAIVFSVGPINDTLKSIKDSGGLTVNSDVKGAETTTDNTNNETVTYPTIESSSTNKPMVNESAAVCYEDGKPVVLLFSTSSCPHCTWIKETFDNWARDNSNKYAVHHYEYSYDNQGNATVIDTISGQTVEIPSEYETLYVNYSGGYVPTFIFGCKYFRIGNGFEVADTSLYDQAYADEVAEYNYILGLLE